MPRRRLSASERRELIEQAATEVFAQQGFRGASIGEIAKRAGVTPPVLYDHFESKEALHRRLLERQRDELVAFWTARMPLPDGPEAFAQLLDAYFAYVEAHPFAYRMYFRDSSHPDVHKQATTMLAAILAGQPGWQGAGQALLEMATEVLRTGLIGLALWWQEHPEVARAEVVEAAMRALSMAPAPAAS